MTSVCMYIYTYMYFVPTLVYKYTSVHVYVCAHMCISE